MNLIKYEAFVRVVEEGSLTNAAQKLDCTQSAVSHMLNGLEEELGFRILVRNRAGIKLTPEGERVLPAIRTILGAGERLSEISAAIHGLNAGTVRIGTFTSVAVHWLPGIIKTFSEKYPRIDFKLLNGDYYDVENWLADFSIDVGFVRLPGGDGCEYTPLREDRILAILPKEHPYAGKSFLPLEALHREPFISLLEESNHDVRSALEGTGIELNVKYYTKDDYAIIAMVAQGLGISIMPELLLENGAYDVEALELENHPSRTIGLAVPRVALASPATRAFAEHAINWVKSNGK